MNIILNEILTSCDNEYAEFSKKLIPDTYNILGLRAPKAKEIAKKYANTDTGDAFFDSLPHKYHDENIIHAYMLGYLKADFNTIKERLIQFLPYIENWAVCDSLCMGLKRFFKDKDLALDVVSTFLKSDKPYYIRVGLVCLLDYYVEDKYTSLLLDICKGVKSEHYYVKMALAWLISVMLVKLYTPALSLFDGSLEPWVHNKSIQKATESYRIDDSQKKYLKSLKIRGAK